MEILMKAYRGQQQDSKCPVTLTPQTCQLQYTQEYIHTSTTLSHHIRWSTVRQRVSCQYTIRRTRLSSHIHSISIHSHYYEHQKMTRYISPVNTPSVLGSNPGINRLISPCSLLRCLSGSFLHMFC